MGVIRSRKSNIRQYMYNSQKKNDKKRRNNGKQDITYKTKI